MSYSHSSSGGYSTSNPTVLQTPQSQLALSLANFAANLASQTYQWAAQTYQGTSAMTTEAVQNYLQMSQLGLGLANENLDDYNNIYRPEMAQLADEAGSYSSAARQEVNEGAAEAQSEAGSNAGLTQAQQQLQAYGINPNSGMYQELVASNRAAAGAAAAGAGQEAGLATQATGRQLLQASLQQGDQLPASAVNAINSAYEGVAGAENSTLANANTGANLYATAAPFVQSAMQLRYPQPSQISRSAQSSFGNSSPSQRQNSGRGSNYGNNNATQPAIPRSTPSAYSQQGGGNPGGGGGGANGGGGSHGGSGIGGGANQNAKVVSVGNQDQNDQDGGNYSDPYSVGGNPFILPQGIDSTTVGGTQAGQFMDPYSATGTIDPTQNLDNFNTQGLQTGSASIGQPSQPAIPYANVGGLGGNAPANSPSTTDPFGDTGGTSTGFGGGVSAIPPSTSPDDTWNADLSTFNPFSTADAAAPSDESGGVGSSDSVPQAQDQSQGNYGSRGDYGGGGGGGGEQPVQQSSASDYTSPAPEEEDTGGGGSYGGGGYAAGGSVRRGMGRGFLPGPRVSRNIPATRMGGFRSNAPSLHASATTGGTVPKSASPSRGKQTDDIPARLNAEEFVMPRDVTKYFGQRHFHKMIKEARKAMAMHGGSHPNPPARPTMKPMGQQGLQHPRFVSRPVGH